MTEEELQKTESHAEYLVRLAHRLKDDLAMVERELRREMAIISIWRRGPRIVNYEDWYKERKERDAS